MTRRYVSDIARANWATGAAIIVGVLATLGVDARTGVLGHATLVDFTARSFLLTWPIFGAIYLLWTHRTYARRPPAQLRAVARVENLRQRRWWMKLVGFAGASDWTAMAALIAMLLTVMIAQNPSYRANLLYIALALASVATAWGLMAYSFAIEYVRLNASRPVIRLHVEDGPVFDDYLTFSVLVTAMGSFDSAAIAERAAWRVARLNVLCGFVFNSVIVAMVVSLVLGGVLK